MPFTTLDAVKDKLGIPQSVSAYDIPLSNILAAVESRIERRTGYSLVARTSFVETRTNIQTGTPFYTKHRPLTLIRSIEGRLYGEADWTTLEHDVVDADKGQVILIPGSTYDWPPLRTERPANYFRWRDFIWDIVRITYDVSAYDSNTHPAELSDAAAAWVAYLYDRHGGAAASSRDDGVLSQTFMVEDIPPWVNGPLSSHARDDVLLIL